MECLFKGGSIWGEHPRKEKDDKVSQVQKENPDDSVCGSCDCCEESKNRKHIQESV